MPEIIIKLGDNIVHKYILDKDIISIGRARDNDIVIENLSVSRNHARIRKVDGKYIVTDLNSANGTQVNGVQITKTELVDNDVISIGKHKLQFVNKPLTDEQIISDAFGADRTMIVDKTPTACVIVSKGRQKDQEFKITKYETTIGRSAENDIRLHDWFVSKKHAVIIRQGQKFFIKDLGSWRGLKIGDKQIKETELNDGDEIEFGTTSLLFRFSEEGEIPISGRVPKELGVDEVQPQQVPGNISDEEIAKAMSDEDFDMDEKVKTPVPSGDSGANEAWVSDEDMIEVKSGDDYDDGGKIDISPESIEERILAEEKESQEMIRGFERIEEEEEILEGAMEHKEEVKPEKESEMPVEAEPVKEIQKEIPTDTAKGGKSKKKKDKQPAAPQEKPPVEEPKAEEPKIEEPKTEEKATAEQKEPEQKESVHIAIEKHPVSSQKEIEIWEKALTNKSLVIRKQAVQMLKKLTGKDYKYE